VTVQLREIAFARSGDKGDICSIGVVPYDEEHFELLREQVTVDRVRELFGSIVKGRILRYEFRGIKALNFVLYNALDGGVSRSMNLDVHGKTFASLMLSLPMELEPTDLRQEKERARV
jgi:hypothetical protein